MLHYLAKGHKEVPRFKTGRVLHKVIPERRRDTHQEFDKLVLATDLGCFSFIYDLN